MFNGYHTVQHDHPLLQRSRLIVSQTVRLLDLRKATLFAFHAAPCTRRTWVTTARGGRYVIMWTSVSRSCLRDVRCNGAAGIDQPADLPPATRSFIICQTTTNESDASRDGTPRDADHCTAEQRRCDSSSNGGLSRLSRDRLSMQILRFRALTIDEVGRSLSPIAS